MAPTTPATSYRLARGHSSPHVVLNLIKRTELLVLLRNHRDRQRPGNTKLGIIVIQSTFGIWCVELAYLITGIGIISERLVAVSNRSGT